MAGKAYFYNMSEAPISLLVNGSLSHLMNLNPPSLATEATLMGGHVARGPQAMAGVLGVNGENEIKFWNGDDMDYAVTINIPGSEAIATINRDVHVFVFQGALVVRTETGAMQTFQAG